MSQEEEKVQGQEEGKEARKASPPQAGGDKELGSLKSGDYMVHLLIQEARQLTPKQRESTINPMVQVECFGKKKHTQTKEKIGGSGTCFWGEHIFFQKNGLRSHEVENQKVKINVNHKSTLKKTIIGSYQFDLTYIYFNDNHCIQHQWVALTDVGGEDFQKITGYLKISVAVIATGDEQVQLKEDDQVDKTDSAMLLMPPQIRTEQYQVIFRIAKAQHLPKLDTFGSCDGFMKVEFLSQKIKNKWVKMKDDQIWWNDQLWIPANVPIVANRILLKVYDYDAGKNDQIIGSIIANFRKINGPMNKMITWENIYGAPPGKIGKNSKLMNRNPEIASTWKGRVLLQYQCFKTDQAFLKCIPIQPNKLISDPPKRYFKFKAEVRQAVCLPNENHKFKIKIKVAELEFQTDKAKVTRGDLNMWNTGFYQDIQLPYFSLEQIERVYVYLMDGDTPICFRRFNVEQIEIKDPEFKWIALKNDQSIGDVDQHYKAGIIQMRMYLGDAQDDQGFKTWPSKMRGDDDIHRVLVHLFQCRDLPAADDNGVSDPYLRIQNFGGKQDFKTQIVEDSINPIYYESLDMYFQFQEINLAPPLVIDIFDYDQFSSDDFIGRSISYLHEFEYQETGEKAGKPRWIKVTPGMENQLPMGEILVGVNVMDPEGQYNLAHLNQIMRPQTAKIEVEINILGLRGLQSTGLIPVKKPFVKFNLNSLVPPNEGGLIQNVKTQPSAPGPNANINSVIRFKIKLPMSPLYCPKIACAVYDYIFKGLSQPLLGTFSIPIGDMMKQQQDGLKETLQKMDQSAREIEVKLQEMKAIPTPEMRPTDEEDQMVSQRMGGGLLGERSQRSDSVLPGQIQIQLAQMDGQDQDLSARGGLISGISGDQEEEQKRRQPELDEQGKINVGDPCMPPRRTFIAQLVKKSTEFDLVAYKKERKFLGKFVIYPEYEFDKKLKFQREVNKPPSDLFFPLGYDPKKGDKIKHYRRSFQTQLQDIDDCLGPTPFDVFDLHRGQSRKIAKADFHSLDPEAMKIPIVGKFKGLIKVGAPALMFQLEMLRDAKLKAIIGMLEELYQKRYKTQCDIEFENIDKISEKKKLQKLIVDCKLTDTDIIRFVQNKNKYETISKQLLVPTRVIVRVYVIEAFGLPPKDCGSDSDPYVVLKLGKKKIEDRDNYKLDTPHPQWYKHYDFETTIPGPSLLKLQVWDYDTLFSDDFIGETEIDIEDRFFSPKWNSLIHKPVELRSLFAPTSSVQQGQLRLWLDILPVDQSAEKRKAWNIQPRPQSEFQIRVCVFSTKDVKTFDIEGTSDIYIRAFIDSDDPHQTDVHYRCQTGKGSFNWRMLFDEKFPRKHYHFSIQIWDKDFFSGNDYIADAAFDFEKLAHDVFESGKGMSLNKKYYQQYMKPEGEDDPIKWADDDCFWLPCRSKDPQTGEFVQQGQVLIRFDIVEMSRAKGNPVGKGRTEPNHSPYLPPPTGRISWSLNPFKMIVRYLSKVLQFLLDQNQLIGPEWRRKFYICCCTICCVVVCAAMAPLIFSNLVSDAIASIF